MDNGTEPHTPRARTPLPQARERLEGSGQAKNGTGDGSQVSLRTGTRGRPSPDLESQGSIVFPLSSPTTSNLTDSCSDDDLSGNSQQPAFSRRQTPAAHQHRNGAGLVCPLCKRESSTPETLLNHIRKQHEAGRQMARAHDNFVSSMGWSRCPRGCMTILTGACNGRHKCPVLDGTLPIASRSPPASPTSNHTHHTSAPTPTTSTTSTPSTHAAAPDSSSTAQPSSSNNNTLTVPNNPGPPSPPPPPPPPPPSAPTPATHVPQAHPQGSQPSATFVPSWANGITLKHVAGGNSPRSVPGRIAKAWGAALARTCKLVIANHYSEEATMLLLLLPRAGIAKWAGKGWCATSNRVLAEYPNLSPSVAEEVVQGLRQTQPVRGRQGESGEDVHGETARLRAVKRLVAEGHLRKAVRTLLSDGVAGVDNTVLEALEALHPHPPVNQMSPFMGTQPAHDAALFRRDQLEAVVGQLARDSAPGPTGWSFAMVRDTVEGGATGSKELMDVLEGLGRKYFRGGVSTPLRNWFRASRLIPLKKKGGGVRPIACGEAFHRIWGKWALQTVDPAAVLLAEQFGVGNKGGVEPMVWSVRDAVDQARVLLCIDFKNAFNMVSRKRIAEAVRQQVPSLYRFVQSSYSAPSPLLVRDSDGQVHTVESKRGVRQGDPLGPLLFSLAVQPLIKQLKELFCKDGGRVWAYLDDLVMEVESVEVAQQVITWLGQPHAAAVFGLEVNTDKCRVVVQEELQAVGMPLLGSWVGGPVDEEGGAAALVIKAVEEVRNRLPLMRSLPLQHQLLLLRLCFVPTVSHLARSLHPDASDKGTAAFDQLIEDAVNSLLHPSASPGADNAPAAPLAPPCVAAIHLPVRFGGLGLTSQHATRHVACGSSFVLAQGDLHERGLSVSAALQHTMRPLVETCAANINQQVDDLLGTPGCFVPHLQRRAAEVLHESSWRELFDSLGEDGRIRLCENGGLLAGKWMHELPFSPLTSLSDDEMLYALRRTLLLPLHPPPQLGLCPRCNMQSNAHHHLACSGTSGLRTYRHTALRGELARALESMGRPVRQEWPHGGVKHDIVVEDGAACRVSVDVGVAHVPVCNSVQWPENDDEDGGEGQSGANESAQGEPDVAPAVSKARKFRSKAVAASVGRAVSHYAEEKQKKFASDFHAQNAGENWVFIPFVVSAGGTMHHSAEELVRKYVSSSGVVGKFKAANIKRRLLGRMSVVCVQFARRMADRVSCVSLSAT